MVPAWLARTARCANRAWRGQQGVSAITTPALLKGDGLACVRGERLVFEDLSFAVAQGEALVLRGPNGSGKTSFLRLIAGLLRCDAGDLTWQGRDVSDDPEAWRSDVCFVGHLDGIKPLFTVSENIAFWACIAGAGNLRVGEGLDRFGLAPLSDVPARFLSAGQRRRVGLARLVAAPAPVWLLDEPTVSLDAESVATLAEVMKEHRAAGGLVIAATHAELDLADAKTLAFGKSEAT
jgi:heme exporter protein A